MICICICICIYVCMCVERFFKCCVCIVSNSSIDMSQYIQYIRWKYLSRQSEVLIKKRVQSKPKLNNQMIELPIRQDRHECQNKSSLYILSRYFIVYR